MDSGERSADRILDVAERLIRARGFDGVSFRDVAAAVGIRSASVHYHFPTKAELGVAVMRRYAERFFAALDGPDAAALSPVGRLARYVATFRRGLADEGLMCLGGMMGAEVAGLPPAVAAEARRFAERNLAWLETLLRAVPGAALSPADARARACTIFAVLEGAMILSRTLDTPDPFDLIAERLLSRALPG